MTRARLATLAAAVLLLHWLASCHVTATVAGVTLSISVLAIAAVTVLAVTAAVAALLACRVRAERAAVAAWLAPKAGPQ